MGASGIPALTVALDEEDDELDVLLTATPVPSVGLQLDRHVYIRVDPRTRSPVGITITDFSLWSWKRLTGYEHRRWDRRRPLPVLGPALGWLHLVVVTLRFMLHRPRSGQTLLANRKLLALELQNLLREYDRLRQSGRVRLVSSN